MLVRLSLFFWCCIFSAILFAESNDVEALSLHKNNFLKNLLQQKKPSSYPWDRVVLSIQADDSDYIPKVPHAGEVFEENGISYQIMHNGIKVLKDCYYDAWMTDVIFGLKGHHEAQEEKAFYEVLKYMPENAVMIELGSYWAYYSLWFASAITNAKNYMIEPDIARLNFGKKHFELNNKEGSFYHAFVGKRTNDRDVDFSGIPYLSIDSFMKDNAIEHVNILHSDIQGAEFDMLLSAEKAIYSNKIDYFFISTHGDLVHDSCLNLLQNANFMVIVDCKIDESCSADGLIVARRPDVRGPIKIDIKKY